MKPLVLKANKYVAGATPDKNNMPYMMLWVPSVNSGLACNQYCDYCATRGWEPDTNPLKYDKLLDIVDQAKELNVRQININGPGEPLMYKKVLDLAEYIHEKQIPLRFTINGTKVTKKTAEKLFDLEASAVIKLHSLDRPEVHDKLVRKKNSHDMVLRGIDNLVDAGFPSVTEDRKFRYTQLGIMTLLGRPCYNDIGGVLDYCSENQFYPMIDDIVVAGEMDAEKYRQYALTDAERRNVAKLFERSMKYPIMTYTLDVCSMDTGGMFIGRDGRYYADDKGSCCDALATADFGDVRKRPLKEVWSELLALREQHRCYLNSEFAQYRKKQKGHRFTCFGMWKSQMDAGVLNENKQRNQENH